MAFVNLSLVLGTMLVGIPIALHLVMRQKPKQLVFPAIRFLQKRQESNRRTLRLRHWILLLLRCLVVALAAMALARPSVSSHLFGNWIIITGLGGGPAFWGRHGLSSRHLGRSVAPQPRAEHTYHLRRDWHLGWHR